MLCSCRITSSEKTHEIIYKLLKYDTYWIWLAWYKQRIDDIRKTAELVNICCAVGTVKQFCHNIFFLILRLGLSWALTRPRQHTRITEYRISETHFVSQQSLLAPMIFAHRVDTWWLWRYAGADLNAGQGWLCILIFSAALCLLHLTLMAAIHWLSPELQSVTIK